MHAHATSTTQAIRRLPLDLRMCRLLGKWEVKGQQFPDSTSPPAPVHGIESFERSDDKPYLVHRFHGHLAKDVVDYTEMIGNQYVRSHYDDGHEQVWTSVFTGDTWKTTSTSYKKGEWMYMRCTTHFMGETRRYVLWERSTDGVTWTTHWIMVCTKVRAAAMGFAA